MWGGSKTAGVWVWVVRESDCRLPSEPAFTTRSDVTCHTSQPQMSLLTKQNRITVKQFAAVPALLSLPAVQRAPPSVPDASFRWDDGGINLSEGCLVTKTVKYTHQLVHWVNAVRGGDPSDVVGGHFKGRPNCD